MLYDLKQLLRLELWRFFGGIILLSFYSSDCKSETGDPNPYAELYSDISISKMENYVGLDKGWDSRIKPLDQDAKNYVIVLNKIDGFDDSPAQTPLFESFKKEIAEALESEPEPIQSLLKEKLFRIYVCESLGGSAVTGIVHKNQNVIGGFIIIDAKVLNRKANDWISYKENSAYTKRKTNLKITIEERIGNTKQNAIRYILLHEFGHILSETESIAPSHLEKFRSFQNLPFSGSIWKSENISYLDTSTFPLRPKIRFYSGSISLDDQWKNIYPALEKTPFPTLYAANNADDFFAESFVSYVHVVLEKRPWKLELIQNGKTIYQTENGILKPQLQTQREILKRILEKK